MRPEQRDQFNDVMILMMFAVCFLYAFIITEVYLELEAVKELLLNCQCQ